MGLTLESYQVGWICALPIEADLAELMLDRIHDPIPLPARDENIYTFGQIDVDSKGASHNVVIARLPAAETGTAAAATVAKDMLRTFTHLKFGLMVGIAGGIWSPKVDVRLGDVVVGAPDDNGPGVVQYDHGKYIQGKKFVHRGILDKAPKVLRTAVSVAKQVRKRKAFLAHLDDEDVRELAPRPANDILFEAAYPHFDGSHSCVDCEVEKLRKRPARPTPAPLVHYGAIASGNGVVKDALFADDIRSKHGVLCFEMEAAGLDNFPCLVIRGISDYADTHKNDDWHAYAASTAAAYAKELLRVVPLTAISQLPSIGNKHWFVPRPSIPLFTGRREILQRMKDCLVSSSDIDRSRRPNYVLYGMGGSGKSETAIKFAEENRDNFWGVLWVNADTQLSAERGLASIARTCQLSDTSIESVTSWLASIESSWLLVLDNCDNVALDYSKLCPSGQSGGIVITTRLKSCQVYGPFDVLDDFGLEDSMSLFVRACGLDLIDQIRHDANAVIELVGRLAIAIVHAGAFIKQDYCTVQEYPETFRAQRERAMKFKPVQLSSEHGSVYTTFQITAEALSVSTDDESRLALDLLRILAFLDHKGVEEDIFDRALKHCQLMEQDLNVCREPFDQFEKTFVTVSHDVQPPYHSPEEKEFVKQSCSAAENHEFKARQQGHAFVGDKELSMDTGEKLEKHADDGEIHHLSLWHCKKFRSMYLFASDNLFQLRASRSRLAELSLIQINKQTISMHPLVHEWARVRLSVDERQEAWSETVCVLALSVRGSRNWQPFTMGLQTHIETCFKDHQDVGHLSKIPLNLARSLFVLAWQLHRAENSLIPLELFLAISDKCLLQPHTKSVKCQTLSYCKAVCLIKIPDRVSEAIRILRMVISSRLEILGPESRSIQQAQHALAVCFAGQDKHQKVVDLLAPIVTRFQATAMHEGCLGQIDECKFTDSVHDNGKKKLEGHQQIACMLELSWDYKGLGENEKAILLLEELVTCRTPELPPADPRRVLSMDELAVAYINVGKNEQALILLEEVVKLRSSRYIPSDPSRLNSMHRLAVAYINLGKHKQALALLEDVVKLRSSTLTSSDPLRLKGIHELAVAHMNLGQNERALPLLEELVELRSSTLGPSDPSRLDSMYLYKLAVVCVNLGKHGQALMLLEEVVKLQSQILPSDDLARMGSVSALATVYQSFGLFQEAIEVQEEVLGLKHGYELSCEDSQSNSQLLRLDFDGRGKSMGHKERVQSAMMHNLAVAYIDTNRIQKAKELLELVVAFRTELFPPNDRRRLVSMQVLATAYVLLRNVHKFYEAIKLLEFFVSNGTDLLESEPELLVWTEVWLAEARGMACYRSVIAELNETIGKRPDSQDRKDDLRDG